MRLVKNKTARFSKDFPKNFQLWSDEIEVTRVECGENVRVKLKGVEENDISQGFVLCDPNNPIKSCRIFDAQVSIGF